MYGKKREKRVLIHFDIISARQNVSSAYEDLFFVIFMVSYYDIYFLYL